MAGEQVRILVVDDEESVRTLLKRTLEEAGYKVATATNGEEAWHKLHADEAEVVLLDVKMPGISGMELLGKITTDWPDICVIMATAVADTKTAVEAMKMGAYDYVTKPFNLDDVLLRVQRAVERRRLQVQRRHLMLELQESVSKQSERMQVQFSELVSALAREHKLLFELGAKQPGGAKAALSRLPPELREPITSVEEFKKALLKILGKA